MEALRDEQAKQQQPAVTATPPVATPPPVQPLPPAGGEPRRCLPRAVRRRAAGGTIPARWPAARRRPGHATGSRGPGRGVADLHALVVLDDRGRRRRRRRRGGRRAQQRNGQAGVQRAGRRRAGVQVTARRVLPVALAGRARRRGRVRRLQGQGIAGHRHARDERRRPDTGHRDHQRRYALGELRPDAHRRSGDRRSLWRVGSLQHQGATDRSASSRRPRRRETATAKRAAVPSISPLSAKPTDQSFSRCRPAPRPALAPAARRAPAVALRRAGRSAPAGAAAPPAGPARAAPRARLAAPARAAPRARRGPGALAGAAGTRAGPGSAVAPARQGRAAPRRAAAPARPRASRRASSTTTPPSATAPPRLARTTTRSTAPPSRR